MDGARDLFAGFVKLAGQVVEDLRRLIEADPGQRLVFDAGPLPRSWLQPMAEIIGKIARGKAASRKGIFDFCKDLGDLGGALGFENTQGRGKKTTPIRVWRLERRSSAGLRALQQDCSR